MSRNVVLVTIDSVRADHCGYMGYNRETTPAIDKMAEEGIGFTDAVAPGSRTPESMPVIFTGEYPLGSSDQKLTTYGENISRHLSVHNSIAERFSQAGYATAGFTPNGYTSRYFGYDNGFDLFQDFLEEERRSNGDLPNIIESVYKLVRQEEKFKAWEKFYQQIIDWVNSADEPYFLWVLLMDTHNPYFSPKQFRKQNSWFDMFRANFQFWRHELTDIPDSGRHRLVDAYDDALRYTDEFVRRIQIDLEDSDPVFAVHSDHGEAFGEHETYGHGGQLYEEYVNVPLVIGNVDESATIDRPVSLRHLPDILANLREPPTTAGSLTDGIDGPILARADQNPQVMLRLDNWKYIHRLSNPDELYDLTKDPEERQNMIAEDTELHRSLQQLAEQYASSAEKRVIVDSIDDCSRTNGGW